MGEWLLLGLSGTHELGEWIGVFGAADGGGIIVAAAVNKDQLLGTGSFGVELARHGGRDGGVGGAGNDKEREVDRRELMDGVEAFVGQETGGERAGEKMQEGEALSRMRPAASGWRLAISTATPPPSE